MSLYFNSTVYYRKRFQVREIKEQREKKIQNFPLWLKLIPVKFIFIIMLWNPISITKNSVPNVICLWVSWLPVLADRGEAEGRCLSFSLPVGTEAQRCIRCWQAHYDKAENMLYNFKRVKISFGYKSVILLLMTVIGNIPMMGGH